MQYFDFIELFATIQDAINFECQVLSAVEDLPKVAMKVLNRDKMTEQEKGEYYDWLASQMDA